MMPTAGRFHRRAAAALLLSLAPMAGAPAMAGAIHKWVDEDGVTHYSNLPRDEALARRGKVAITPAERGGAARAAIYKFRDARGVTHYTDQRPSHARFVTISVYCPACDPHSPVDWDRTALNLTAYADAINAAAARHGVDPALVRAIIHAESAFRADAVSRKGAQGLMQLMPATAELYGVSDPFDAEENIAAGVEHLAKLLEKYRGDVSLAAAAYNAGEGAVTRYGGVPPFEETRFYVQRVGTLHRRYLAGG